MKKLALIIAPLFFCMFLTELGLRFTIYKALLLRPEVRVEDDPRKQFYITDPSLGFRIQQNTIGNVRSFPFDGMHYVPKSNELGCYDDSIKGVDIEEAILAIGDSFTFGTHEIKDGWPSLLENYTNRRVLKCGVDSYGTKQEFNWTKRLLAQLSVKPKFVILQYYIGNDMFDDHLNPAVVSVKGQKIFKHELTSFDFNTGIVPERSVADIENRLQQEVNSQPSFLSRNLVLYALIEGAFSEKGISSIKIPTSTSASHSPSLLTFNENERSWLIKSWENHLNNISEFKGFLDSQKIPFVVIVIPTNEQIYPFLLSDEEREIVDLLKPNQILKEYFIKNEIRYLDLTSIFRSFANQRDRPMLDADEDLYNRVDGHFSLLGEKLAALSIAKFLAETIPEYANILNPTEIEIEKFGNVLLKQRPTLLADQRLQVLSYGPKELSSVGNPNNSASFWVKLNKVSSAMLVKYDEIEVKPVIDLKDSVLTFSINDINFRKSKSISFRVYDKSTGLDSDNFSVRIDYPD